MKVAIRLHAEVEYDGDESPEARADLELTIARWIEVEEMRLAEAMKNIPGLKISFADSDGEDWKEQS